MESGTRKESTRVVPRWVVVVGILVIMGIAVYGLGRVVIPMQHAAAPQSSERAPASGSVTGRGDGQRRGMWSGFVGRILGHGRDEEDDVATGEVVLLDAEHRIDASGALIALQSGEMYWKTTGTVAHVLVEVGNIVQAGETLMKLDPLSAPQNVIMAQADLIAARKSLDDLNYPTALQISNAQNAVSDAEEYLDQLQDPAALAIANAQQAVADAQDNLDLLQNPTALDVAKAEQVMADAQDNFERLQNPTALDVAEAQQAVADSNESLTELQYPTDAQIAASEEAVALSRDTLRDKQDELAKLLDIEALEDVLRDAEFQLARVKQDIELADIGTSTSTLKNARDALEKMQERRIAVQKGLQACIVYKVEQDDERDYTQLTVSEEVVHNDFTFFVGTVYEVFDETATTLIEQYGNIVEQQYLQKCDPLRAVTVDGVTRTLAEADEDLLSAQDGLREAELKAERTRMGNTTALDLATEAVQDAREDLDDAILGGDPIDLALAQAVVDDAAGELADMEEQLAKLLDPNPEDVAVASGKLEDAKEQLDLLIEPKPEDVAVAAAKLEDAKEQLDLLIEPKPNDVAVAVGKLEDASEHLEQLLDPRPSDVAVAEATLADMQDQLDALLLGPDADEVTAAEARVTAAEATLRLLRMEAPFAGQVLAVNYLPGDATEQSISAVRLANMEQLRVEVSVDETEVSGIQVGQPAVLTFDALASIELAAEVTHVAPYGETVQGLVRYPVTVTLNDSTSDLMLGMTAHVQIVTEVLQNALAVPIDAVQYDDTGEYVMLFNGPGEDRTRVSIESGVIQGEQVVVSGNLESGQEVVLFTPKPTESGSPFGGRD